MNKLGGKRQLRAQAVEAQEECRRRESLFDGQYYETIGFGLTREQFDWSLITSEIAPERPAA